MKYSILALFLAALCAPPKSLNAQTNGCLRHISNRIVSVEPSEEGNCTYVVELCLAKQKSWMAEMHFQVNYSTGALDEEYDVKHRPVGFSMCHTFEFETSCNLNLTLTGYGRDAEKSFCGVWSTFYALPVDLISFTGEMINGESCLSWEVSQEENIKRYVVEHGSNGQDFVPVAQIPANAQGLASYIYDHCHSSPHPSVNYYRLAIWEEDGSFNYSPIISILSQDQSDAITIYPNPSSDFIQIQGIQGRYDLLDIAGSSVFSGDQAEGQMDISHLRPGTYFLTFHDGKRCFKIIKR